MGQNVECKNIEWDKMSNGNIEGKVCVNIFGFLLLLSDYMGTAVQHTDRQSLLVEENHTIQVILQAHIAVVQNQVSQLLRPIPPGERPGLVVVRTQVPHGGLLKAGIRHGLLFLKSLHEVPVGWARRQGQGVVVAFNNIVGEGISILNGLVLGLPFSAKKIIPRNTE
jgi:hypothetical protein